MFESTIREDFMPTPRDTKCSTIKIRSQKSALIILAIRRKEKRFLKICFLRYVAECAVSTPTGRPKEFM